jgi:hypothetical protein
LISAISKSEAWNCLKAASLPGPNPLILTDRALTPFSCAVLATACATNCAA